MTEGEALRVLAADEQRHAELAEDIVKFCVDRGGRAIRRAAREAADSQRIRLAGDVLSPSARSDEAQSEARRTAPAAAKGHALEPLSTEARAETLR